MNKLFHSLDDTARVAQMIVTVAGELGKPDSVVFGLVRQNKIGGAIFLKGTKKNHQQFIYRLNAMNDSLKNLPLFYLIDGEPSLLSGRLEDVKPLVSAKNIKTTHHADSIAKIISSHLKEVGFHQNLAPVVDLSIQNEAIKTRSFGSNKKKVIALSKQFIKTTQEQGIIATAKHFPGHGLVHGDTHKKSVYLKGNLKELSIYPPLINAGVISIMIAHITIVDHPQYNTHRFPASCSRKIVTDLLKNELGFKGLAITDALMDMKSVTAFDNAALLASKAGNDLLLMPIDEIKIIHLILNEMKKDFQYREQIYESIKKIIRLKIYLGLI